MANQPEFYVFLHGMTENGSVNGGGQIATHIANIFKVPIEQPNLNVPSFAEFSVSNAIRIVDKLYEEKSQGNPSIQMILIGASMGTVGMFLFSNPRCFVSIRKSFHFQAATSRHDTLNSGQVV